MSIFCDLTVIMVSKSNVLILILVLRSSIMGHIIYMTFSIGYVMLVSSYNLIKIFKIYSFMLELTVFLTNPSKLSIHILSWLI